MPRSVQDIALSIVQPCLLGAISFFVYMCFKEPLLYIGFAMLVILGVYCLYLLIRRVSVRQKKRIPVVASSDFPEILQPPKSERSSDSLNDSDHQSSSDGSSSSSGSGSSSSSGSSSGSGSSSSDSGDYSDDESSSVASSILSSLEFDEHEVSSDSGNGIFGDFADADKSSHKSEEDSIKNFDDHLKRLNEDGSLAHVSFDSLSSREYNSQNSHSGNSQVSSSHESD